MPLIRPPMSAAVVQPLPGIGDMVWHLPHIRAIAAHLGVPVTLIAKPRSLANQLLAHEPAVRDIMEIDLNPDHGRGRHDGIAGFVRLTRELRARRFDRIILLHHSATIAAAAWLAGIPDRRGYGWGAQRLFLNHGPFPPKSVASLHQHTRATIWLRDAGIPLASPEPSFPVTPEADAAARAKLAFNQPFIAMGIGSSETSRQSGPLRLAEIASALIAAGWPKIVLIGGPGDAMLAEAIATALSGSANEISWSGNATGTLGSGNANEISASGNATGALTGGNAAGTSASGNATGALTGGNAIIAPGSRNTTGTSASGRVIIALGWDMQQVAAVLRHAAFYVGNNTGVMNLAAAVGTRTYALFGTTPPFHHASQIVPILSPPGGAPNGAARSADDGMARVTTEMVLDAIRADRGSLRP